MEAARLPSKRCISPFIAAVKGSAIAIFSPGSICPTTAGWPERTLHGNGNLPAQNGRQHAGCLLCKHARGFSSAAESSSIGIAGVARRTTGGCVSPRPPPARSWSICSLVRFHSLQPGTSFSRTRVILIAFLSPISPDAQPFLFCRQFVPSVRC